MSQPQIKTDIEARVQDTGDTMTGDLKISTPGDSLPDLILQNSSGATGYSVLTKNASSTADYGTQLADYGSTGNSARFVIRADKAYNDLDSFIYVYCKDANNENAIYYKLLHSGNYTNYTLSKNNSIHMLSDVNASANLGKYSSIFRTTTTNCDGVAPSTYAAVARFRSGYNGSYDLWLSSGLNGRFYIARTADGALTTSESWKELAIFDANHALSTNNYTNQSTVPIGGIKIHDIRNATVNPGSFGSYVANFYFDQAANGYWKTVLNTTGWTAGSYASHELAFNSDVGTTTEDYSSLYHRTGVNNTWTSWYKILDEKNYSNFLNGKFLPITGGTMTGQIKINRGGSSWIGVIEYPEVNYIYADHSSGTSSVYHSMLALRYANHTFSIGGERSSEQFGIYAYNNTRTVNGQDAGLYVASDLNFYCTTKLYGAVWNDYAEYRNTVQKVIPGEVVIENGDGSLRKSTKRLEPGANIVSDTFGFAIGETDECQTPLAVAGRVLAYPAEDRYSYEPGQAVCSAPDGKISKMTREEMINYPDCIVGFVSEIPEYKVWGTGNVEVNNRIWIKVK